jgi:glycosyltransferase involved in cell wall biosynthesis
MRFAVVARQIPDPEGTAAGRALWAWCDGARRLGHDVAVRSWRPEPPTSGLPEWCAWEPLPIEPAWRVRARALVRPRADAAGADWTPADDAVVVADDVTSFAAIPRSARARSVATVHYRVALDVAARGGAPRPRDLQEWRAERRVTAQAAVVLAYSARVASGAGPRARVVPIAYPMPDAAVAPVDQPVAAVLADWSWPPNATALDHLLRAWPAVRARVAGARLLLGGAGSALSRVGAIPGVEVVGTVARARDLLARAAVVPFPCPPSSGPKVKVLEALAYGVAVVTTQWGAEGLSLDAAASEIVVGADGFAARLAELLVDPERRSALASLARQAVVRAHAPEPAARARVDALSPAVG